MGAFENAFEKIGKAFEDMASLEVVSYKGRIKITAENVDKVSFQEIINQCSAHADLRVTACTLSLLDGDMQAFFDKEITLEEMEAHLSLVETAQDNRRAMVDFFTEAIGRSVSSLNG